MNKITFVQCTFDKIPSEAFKGLKQLKELRFQMNYILSLNSGSIANIENLITLEFSDTNIRNIQTNAISDLANLYELSFLRCDIVGMGRKSINIIRATGIAVPPNCNEIQNNFVNNHDEEMFDGIPLPKLGSRLIFHKSNISIIENSAIESNIFSFIVLTGNKIVFFAKHALNVQIQNQCDLSSLLIVDNVFENFETDSFAHVHSLQSSPETIHFLLKNNTFHIVMPNAFRLHSSLQVSAVFSKNNFICKCDHMQWYQSTELTPRTSTPHQAELEQSLVATGKCLMDGTGVKEFLSTCSMEEVVTLPTAHRHHTVHTGLGHPSKSESSHISSANLVHVVIAALIILL